MNECPDIAANAKKLYTEYRGRAKQTAEFLIEAVQQLLRDMETNKNTIQTMMDINLLATLTKVQWGQARAVGRVLGIHEDEPLPPFCDEPIPPFSDQVSRDLDIAPMGAPEATAKANIEHRREATE